MAEMTPKERGRTLSETLLSDIEKTADVQVAARWLINNAAEQIRQAVQVEREATAVEILERVLDSMRNGSMTRPMLIDWLERERATIPRSREHWQCPECGAASTVSWRGST